jgi:hypothetical protein
MKAHGEEGGRVPPSLKFEIRSGEQQQNKQFDKSFKKIY